MIINTSQGKAEMISPIYLEHITKSFNNVLTHLHYMMLDALAFWNLQHTTRAMYKIHHRNEFGFLDLIEWLVACDNPLCQMLFELLLVPWSLLNVLAAEEIKRIGFTYTSPRLLKFKCFFDVFRSAFELLHVFSLGVSIKLSLARCICDLVNSRGLLLIFKDAIEPIHRLDIDVKIVN